MPLSCSQLLGVHFPQQNSPDWNLVLVLSQCAAQAAAHCRVLTTKTYLAATRNLSSCTWHVRHSNSGSVLENRSSVVCVDDGGSDEVASGIGGSCVVWKDQWCLQGCLVQRKVKHNTSETFSSTALPLPLSHAWNLFELSCLLNSTGRPSPHSPPPTSSPSRPRVFLSPHCGSTRAFALRSKRRWLGFAWRLWLIMLESEGFTPRCRLTLTTYTRLRQLLPQHHSWPVSCRRLGGWRRLGRRATSNIAR